MSLRIIGGMYKGRVLKAPKGSATKPTLGMLRESVFNICQNEIGGARFLDLFAGSGAMGLEALSRGAGHVTLVENDRQALAAIRENIAALQAASQTTLIAGPAMLALKRLAAPFDIIYIDPPYDMPILPFIEEILARNLVEASGTLFIEERSGQSFPFSINAPKLSKIGSRRFGEALLHQYRFPLKVEHDANRPFSRSFRSPDPRPSRYRETGSARL